MRCRLALPLLLLVLSVFSPADASGPDLSVTVIDAILESGRDGAVMLNLSNTAQKDLNLSGMSLSQADWIPHFFNESDAVSVIAQLESRDERLHVITGPLYVGAVRAGGLDQVPLEFESRMDDGAEVGIYPLELVLSYSMLADVEISGDPVFPEVFFRYENSSVRIPAAIDVVKGPRLSAKTVGSPRQGDDLEIQITNTGDGIASSVRVRVPPQPGFLRSVAFIGTLDPGASGRFKIKAPDTAGSYPLSLEVSYKSVHIARVEDLAAIVDVSAGGLASGLPAIALVLAVALLALAILIRARPWERLRHKGFRRRRW